MEFIRKAIVTAVLGSMPLIIAALMNLFIDQAAIAQSLKDVKSEFLRVVHRIDNRLDRIENKIDERD